MRSVSPLEARRSHRDRSAVRRFKAAHAPLQNAGECTFLVPEQLGRD
jgi:hypothetical protein